MRAMRLALVGLCAVLAASCGDNSRPAQGSSPPPDDGEGYVAPQIGPWVRFAKDPASAAARHFRTTFALYETRAITTIIGVPEATGPRILRLQITNSEGARARTFVRAFASDDTAGTTVAQPNNGTELQVERARVVNGQAQVEIAIGVAGTDFTRYGLVGTYQAEVFIDGDQPVCSRSFELRGDQ